MKLVDVRPDNFAELLGVWERSVRATHDFLSEEDIAFFKPIIMQQAFPAVLLKAMKNTEGDILGFIGVHGAKIEMLFVDDKARGKGVGGLLLNFAINEHAVTEVDVNEQNPQAVEFYLRKGFEINRRSETDDMGKPFPILHLKLS